jgi:hypothetical protein
MKITNQANSDRMNRIDRMKTESDSILPLLFIL